MQYYSYPFNDSDNTLFSCADYRWIVNNVVCYFNL